MPLEYTFDAFVEWESFGYDDLDYDMGEYDSDVVRIPKLQGITINWGRSNATDQVGTGTATLKVLNNEGVYSRRNTGSPLYGLLLPDRDLFVEMAIPPYGTVRLFTGQTATIGNTYPVGQNYVMNLNAGDAFDRLRLKSIRTGLLENMRIDELVDEILDEAEWPALSRDLDASVVTLGQANWYRANPLEALLTVAKNSLGGHVFVDPQTGYIRFDDYTARSLRTSHMLIQGGQVLDEELRREDFIDSVRFKRAGLDVAVGLTALYTLNPTGRTIYPGSTYPDNTWNFQYGVAGKSVVTPVAYTDYTFNSEADGSGVDRTAQVSVGTFTSYGGGATVIWDNADASVVHCTFFQVRGQASRRSNDERTIEASSASPVVSGQELSRDFEFNDDSLMIQAYAKYLAAISNTGQTRIQFSRIPKDNYELYKLATLGFGSRVTLDIPDAYLTGDWFVEKMQIQLPVNAGLPPNFSMVLFPADAVGGNLFRISGDSGGGQDYSLIVADAATSGDRVAY